MPPRGYCPQAGLQPKHEHYPHPGSLCPSAPGHTMLSQDPGCGPALFAQPDTHPSAQHLPVLAAPPALKLGLSE